MRVRVENGVPATRPWRAQSTGDSVGPPDWIGFGLNLDLWYGMGPSDYGPRKLGLAANVPEPPPAVLEIASTQLLNGELSAFYIDLASASATQPGRCASCWPSSASCG